MIIHSHGGGTDGAIVEDRGEIIIIWDLKCAEIQSRRDLKVWRQNHLLMLWSFKAHFLLNAALLRSSRSHHDHNGIDQEQPSIFFLSWAVCLTCWPGNWALVAWKHLRWWSRGRRSVVGEIAFNLLSFLFGLVPTVSPAFSLQLLIQPYTRHQHSILYILIMHSNTIYPGSCRQKQKDEIIFHHFCFVISHQPQCCFAFFVGFVFARTTAIPLRAYEDQDMNAVPPLNNAEASART